MRRRGPTNRVALIPMFNRAGEERVTGVLDIRHPVCVRIVSHVHASGLFYRRWRWVVQLDLRRDVRDALMP